MVRYVVGFAFDNESKHTVILIQKRKPAWQAGHFNGVGGKVERGESSLEAMIREFKEETTVETTASDWRQFASLVSRYWNVDVYVAFLDPSSFLNARTNTPEQISKIAVEDISGGWVPIVPNLSWLIPMALQSKDDVSFAQATVHYLSVSDVE